MPPSLKFAKIKDSVEERRARGELSCAECRRHKLKCDRNIPCSTCVRKGCQSICPNGTVPPTTSPSPRNAGTGREWVVRMRERIRQLEDALRVAHSFVSTTPHPLLAPDLLEIKNGGGVRSATSKSDTECPPDFLDSFGTLVASNEGEELYIGSLDPLLAKHIDIDSLNLSPSQPGLDPPSPGIISYLSETFPFTPFNLPKEELQRHIEEKLPSYERASALIEAYLENTSWFLRPVDRVQLMEELIPLVYKRGQYKLRTHGSATSQNNSSSTPSPMHPHVLALLFAVFANGAAADLTLPPWNDEADLYYHLARAALGLKSVFEGCGLHAVQAVALIGVYDLVACRGKGIERSWKMIDFSLLLAASIGLNRDPTHFKLSPKLIQRRRQVFWEIFTADVWKSMSTGRPLTFPPECVDCELPEDIDAPYAGDGGETPKSIWWLRNRYIKDIMLEVITKLCALRTVKYAEILSLDQKIRDYDPDGMFTSVANKHAPQKDFRDWLEQAKLLYVKDTTLLCLHHTFFTHALIENPADPARTRFGPSFLCTYRSAASLVVNVRQQLEHSGHSLMRLWPIWAQAITGVVVLGSIAAYGSASALAPQAYVQFNVGYEMITGLQMHPLVKLALPVLARLREQAQQALLEHGNGIPPGPTLTTPDTQDEAMKAEFNPVSSFGRLVQRSRAGEFGRLPPRIGDAMEMRTMPPSSDKPQHLAPTFVGTGTYSEQGRASEDHDMGSADHPAQRKTYLGRNEDTDSSNHAETSVKITAHAPMATSAPTVDMSSELMQEDGHASAHSSSPAASASGQDNARAAYSSGQPTLTQNDLTSFSSSNTSTGARQRSANNPFIDPSFSTYPISPTGADVFNQFTTSPGDSAEPSTRSMYGFSFGQSQEQSYPSAFSWESLAGDHSSSSGTSFNPDFDVSFDMRSSSGQENVLPLLPEDMAWRTFLEDSNFFGKGNEIPESEIGTPR